jgi:diguanylate cyclase (GGDEF)-like protein
MAETILIVDDTLHNLELLDELLTQQGYDVRLAANGKTALTGIAADPPDLILLDIMMSDMNGFEVCTILKNNPQHRDIPIIFLSALDDVKDKVAGFSIGGADYITKPFQTEEVLARIENQLVRKRLQDQLQQANQSLEALNQELEARIRVRTSQLWQKVLYQDLTGLPSRTFLLQELAQALSRYQQDPTQEFALLSFDCDRFSLINHSLGHEMGDQVLIAVARCLEKELHPGELLAHFGEDNYCLLLPKKMDLEEIQNRAQELLTALQKPIHLQDYDVFLTACVGIVCSAAHHEHPLSILRDADTALYRAKLKGRKNIFIMNPSLHARALERLQLERDLQWALQRQEFFMNYQPIINLATGQVWGFEALMRWHHPVRGRVSPSIFIPCMEECGLIIAAGAWALEQACKQLQLWNQSYPNLIMSVNLSPYQFSHPQLQTEIEQILASTGVNPHCLKLEITESAITHPDTALALLNQLQQQGILLSIDDFGTGYSSLSYLRQFPIYSIKIDHSFIEDIGPAGENSAITAAMIGVGHALGMVVIAEGIETAAHLAGLRALHCDYGQGYFFSRPLMSEQVTTLLQQDPQW